MFELKCNSGTDKRGKSMDITMNFEGEDKRIQKKIDWISRQIRETKIQLHKQNQELQKAIKEQEELRKEKKVNSH